jgi:hypothetical protein
MPAMDNKISHFSPFLTLFMVFCSFGTISARVIQVGPGETYEVPSAAVAVAVDGDTIEIAATEYLGDVAAWYQNNLLIRGVGGRPHLRANGVEILGKGTWVIIGNNITVENIEFSEASVPDQNGAGIRQEGNGLTVRNCYFHNNENGMLCDGGDLTVEYCEFSNNGFGYGQTHNIYVVAGDVFTFRYNYSHHAIIGHNLKSRSEENYIEYNRIMDEEDGTSSYAIDIPDGGLTYIIGNLLQQGPLSDNFSAIVSYAAEGAGNYWQNLYIINNTFVNDYGPDGGHIYARSGTQTKIQNNIFVGGGTVIDGEANLLNNWETNNPYFVDIQNFDYRLTGNSTEAIDQGSDPGIGDEYDLTAHWHYLHPVKREARPVVNQIDIGAYEYEAPTPIDSHSGIVSGTYSLQQNHPNPFNPSTSIRFSLPKLAVVKLKIYDVGGVHIATLVNAPCETGEHEVVWNPENIASGIYFYHLEVDGKISETKKMMHLR